MKLTGTGMATAHGIQDEIEATLRHACGNFRCIADPGVGRDCVLSMVFLKHASDAWQDHYAEYQVRYGDHPELVAELLKAERFIVPPAASFDALYARRFEPGVGQRLDQALHALEEANLARLRDVFRDVSFNSVELGDEWRKSDILRHLLEDFARPELDLRPSRTGALDVIGDACEFLLRDFASGTGKKTEAFHTPPQVATLMARLMEPREGDEICDPACGLGSLLIGCGRLVRSRLGTRKYSLYGQEASGGAWALAKINLFLHGEDNHRLEWGDTLRNPKLLGGDGGLKRFDVVVAHPPFSTKEWGHESAAHDRFRRFGRGLPPRTKGDYAFILHMLATLKPDSGRMAVVVPHGVLFRGAAEGRIRRRLVEENLLEAVIGLPQKLFDGAAIPAAILVFRARKADDNVLFIDASREFEPGKNRNSLREKDLERIEKTWRLRRGVDGYAHLASPAEIAENGYNLNIPRYVHALGEEEGIDLKALRRERDRMMWELAGLEEKLAACLEDPGHG